ncbi:Glutamate [NMDA] receptor subunit 3A [Camponotus japonicus]
MLGPYSGVVILLLLGASVSVSGTADAAKSLRAAKARLRSSYASWRIVVCLTQPQTPFKTDVQKAWEEARLESFHADMDVSYIEARMAPMTDSLSYPLSLLNKFCTDIEGGKTVLSLIIGGGSAARFLVTAAAALNLPALWLPFTHRDFLRQGNLGRFENRIGSSPKEIGAAAAALMHRANWHAFTLLVDTTLLPVTHLLQTNQPTRLTPRAIIHLPTNDRTLKLRLRRVAEENGSGGVVVMACDLNNARKILGAAGKFEMLSGRFLWLWLDLKAELRPNEPNVISSMMHGTRIVAAAAAATNENSPLLERTANLASTNDERPPPLMSSLPSLANDIHRLQEYRWRDEKIVIKREDRGFNFDEEENGKLASDRELNSKNFMPVGMLALRPSGIKIMGGDTILSRMLRETSQALDETFQETKQRLSRMREPQLREHFVPECFPDRNAKFMTSDARENVSAILTSKLRRSMRQISKDKAEFQLLNLQAVRFPGNKTQLRWTKVGTIKGGREVRLDTIIWPGGGIVPAYLEQGGEKVGMPIYRIVTALASPFTMVTNLQEGFCLRGLTCQQGDTVMCCYGLSMDLLTVVARELGFRFDLYLAEDGLFGKRNGRSGTWNGVMGELVSGRAQLAFAPLSVSAHRAEVVDFTTPYYFSGVSFLTAPKLRSEIPLFAFLFPFSTELWIAVFTSLNFTAIAVALYEWFSPFGLNPWGRQRSKNFSIASALWVMWGLLCGHLVAFKAPKSWPNKFLINIWGGFSVIFVASYTANIAALIAGLFFHSAVSNYHDKSLLSQRVATPRASAAEYYVQKANPQLWSHMARFSLSDVAEGVKRLRNDTLDILIADTPILDYYRGTDDGCRLQKIGDTINEDTYAIALTKGHPLKESISKVIANYTSNGLLDILQEKWYGGLPCLGGRQGMDAGLDSDTGGQPRPLGVASVAGVFCLLGMGVMLGTIILAGEHLFYKYTLPRLRHRPEDSIWRSRNVMFFSQKLYRFINCVELVSPHHAARELVHTVRQGQIASLFQKSVKRKEHEQRRRRKSKAQFFEMIQEIRRVQQEEKIETVPEESTETTKKDEKLGKGRERSRSKSPLMPRSPKRSEKSRSSTNLSASRLGLSPVSLDAPMKPREFTLSSTNLRARSPLETVGRRLSHGDGGSPPPRLGSHLGGSATLRPTLAATRSESTGGGTPTIRRDSAVGGGGVPTPRYSRSPAKRGQSFPVFATLRPPHSAKSPLLSPNSELTSAIGRKLSREWGSGTISLTRSSEAIGGGGNSSGGGGGGGGGSGSGRSGGSTHTLNQEMTLSLTRSTDEEKAQVETLPIKKPIRRARSHENRDSGKLMVDLPSPRLTQPVVGGRSVSERTKKQLESELKAILSARAHHRDLHPP